MFIYKCGNLFYPKKKLGEKADMFEKYLMGCGGLVVVLIMLLGPLFLFSDLSSELNPVVAVKTSMNVWFENKETGL